MKPSPLCANRKCRQPFVPTADNQKYCNRTCSERCHRKSNYVPVTTPKRRGDPLTADVVYDDEERAFLMAIEAWKRKTGRQYPANTQLLAILKGLGYRKMEGT